MKSTHIYILNAQDGETSSIQGEYVIPINIFRDAARLIKGSEPIMMFQTKMPVSQSFRHATLPLRKPPDRGLSHSVRQNGTGAGVHACCHTKLGEEIGAQKEVPSQGRRHNN